MRIYVCGGLVLIAVAGCTPVAPPLDQPALLEPDAAVILPRDAAASPQLQDAAVRADDAPRPDSLPADAADADGAVAAAPLGLATQIASGGLPGPQNACSGLPGENRLTPGSNIRYCVGAHRDCKLAGGACPLYLTVQGSGAYFGRLKDPAKYGKFITVELRSTGDDEAGTLEAIAQIPRVVARDYPGLDEQRIYVAAQSGGSYFVRRAMCLGPAADRAQAGTISDVYAAWAAIIMCPQCDRPLVPRAGNLHVINIVGELDDVTPGQCATPLRMMAQGLGCAVPAGRSCAVSAGDPLLPRADGSPSVRKMEFGACARGSVVAYVFQGEDHVVRYGKRFAPAVNAYDIAWEFFQDKRKTGGGSSAGTGCGS